jgi:hypothetical protein
VVLHQVLNRHAGILRQGSDYFTNQLGIEQSGTQFWQGDGGFWRIQPNTPQLSYDAQMA